MGRFSWFDEVLRSNRISSRTVLVHFGPAIHRGAFLFLLFQKVTYNFCTIF